MKRILLIIALLGLGSLALAQPKDDGWEKVDGSMTAAAPGETIPANKLVGGAYAFILVALVVWVGSVASRTRKVEDEVESLRQKLAKK